MIKNFTKVTGKHLYRGLFCNKAAYWRPATSLDSRELDAGVFLRILRIYF